MQEYTIFELQKKMQAGEMTASKLVSEYLEQIESTDRSGPRLNSILEINPDALSIASSLDDERAAGSLRGPLHGIPILVKDNIDTADSMQTTAGSIALEGNHAKRDAGVVEKLRAAGAIILGKTNLSEWANFRGKCSTSGWSSRGGLTRNPYALDRTACGSSSGSGAAVAANLAVAAVGTETDGSIICPSQTNGIVGIKPTLGLISRSGIIPISHSQDTAGPMARTVADAAILLGAMAGFDERDSATKPSTKKGLTDYTKFLDKNGLKGARIGVVRNISGSDKDVLDIFEASLDTMKQAGATLIDVELPPSAKFRNTELEVMLFEYKAGLDAYLSGLKPEVKVHSLAELIQFNEENREHVLQYFGQEYLEQAESKGKLTSKKYLKALEKNHRLARTEGIHKLISNKRVDALVCPSGGPAWMIDLVNGDGGASWDMDSTTYPAVAGTPHITVPAGYAFGLPVGLSFFGKAWQEPVLIKLAYAFEQLTKVRVPPRFLKTAELGL